VVNKEAFSSGNTVAAILVAGGSGARIADGDPTPKQFRLLQGKPVFGWSLESLLRCDKVGVIVVVVPPGERAMAERLVAPDPRVVFTDGGATRTASVRSGLAQLTSRPPGKVLIHDAARPGLSVDIVEALIEALDDTDAAAPALPVIDALKSKSGDGVRSVARDGLFRVQTPQAFRYGVLRAGYDRAPDDAVDDLALIEQAGARIVLIPGRQELMKITQAEDFAIASRLLAAEASTNKGSSMRIGNGFDVHAFEPGDGVILCGVKIPHTKKLEGHSDADAGWHALTDAILGAAALGDIGDHFPPSDPRWKGQNSRTFLVHAVKLAAERGFSIVNADITLMCELPRISPHREAMRSLTAEALGVALDRVSVKATTTEKLGFLGREEGIAAQAVVLLGA
jgi:2-C-methyl-D-erythritol 4-phosphate cytidylyltransferase/2-C-methyl-D-erythritol 2,4-cyclodiphosphate synthase